MLQRVCLGGKEDWGGGSTYHVVVLRLVLLGLALPHAVYLIYSNLKLLAFSVSPFQHFQPFIAVTPHVITKDVTACVTPLIRITRIRRRPAAARLVYASCSNTAQKIRSILSSASAGVQRKDETAAEP